MKKHPILLTAFGTATRAMASYQFLQRHIVKHFPGHEILWTVSSTQIQELARKRHQVIWQTPQEALFELAAKGHSWAVVQSTHLACGHEFHRLLAWSRHSSVRTSIGLPLLTEPDDFDQLCTCIGRRYTRQNDCAVILAGHGTDHPAWMVFPLLESILKQRFGTRMHVGVIEGHPSAEEIANRVLGSGFEKALLVPLTMVAGHHFERDLAGNDPNTWKSRLESRGLSVEVTEEGLASYPEVAAILCRHIQAALDVIPDSIPVPTPKGSADRPPDADPSTTVSGFELKMENPVLKKKPSPEKPE